MNKPAFISVPVDTDTLDAIDRVVAVLGNDRESFAADALKRAAEDQAEFWTSIDEAERQIDRGEFYTQEEMEAWFASRRGSAATA